MRTCGILLCYNEEHIINDTIGYYLEQGIDLVVIDNGSTDSSQEIAKSFIDPSQPYPGKLLDVVSLATKDYEWQKILRFACDYMHTHLSSYQWILLIDADSFFASPVRDLTLVDYLQFADQHGANILNGRVYNFYPTQKDDPDVSSPIQRMQYYEKLDTWYQHRIFAYHPSVDFYTRIGHVCLRENPQVFPIKYIYQHYPWTSFEHGLKKIFQDRKPRYVERKTNAAWHYHYLSMLPIKEDLVKSSDSLKRFDLRQVQITKNHAKRIMMLRFLPLVTLAQYQERTKHLLQTVGKLRQVPGTIGKLLAASPFRSFGNPFRMFRTEMRSMQSSTKPLSNKTKAKFAPTALAQTLLSYRSIVHQEPCVFGDPQEYHFLVTNRCNAKCEFCNQDSKNDKKQEITLESFKTMMKHIPQKTAQTFYFSGGGEPLLGRDLLPIIAYINQNLPWVDVNIRTNGLLLEKYAKQLAKLDISRIEISVHDVESEAGKAGRLINATRVFRGLSVLNEQLCKHHSKTRTAFCPVVSQSNIEELPKLIRKAHELGVSEVDVALCRYFASTHGRSRNRASFDNSLFFQQESYNQTIEQAKKLAGKLGIRFEHDPLFQASMRPKPCLAPWRLVVVDWKGEVFPCTGGEIWFQKAVQSGRYYWGNLLREDLYQFWNNDSYVMLRRTLNPDNREDFVVECKGCHNTICFLGADSQEGHLLVHA